MCHGKVTQFSCGHRLESITYRCPQTRSSPPCFVVSWDRYRINDTCADCDPEANIRVVQATYEAKHSELMTKMREAKRKGDSTAVEALTKEVMSLVEWQKRTMRRVVRVGRPEVVVATSSRETKPNNTLSEGKKDVT